MSRLWREAGIAALVCGALGACSTPHYPIDEADARGPAPLTMPKPHYSIEEGQPNPDTREGAETQTQTETPTETPTQTPTTTPTATPSPQVETHDLPPPKLSSEAGDPQLQRASYETQAGDTSTTPVATQTPTTTPTQTPTATPVGEPSITPRMVVHEQSSPPPKTRSSTDLPTGGEGTRTDTPRRTAGQAGDVVDSSGGVFENYEVQKGDHIDALARAFHTTRDVLLNANAVRPPYLLRPGQIIKVPVAKAYIARAGDTLTGVSRRFSVSVDELADLNHISVRTYLRAGQEVGLPSSMRDRGPEFMAAPETQYAVQTRRPEQTLPTPEHHVTQEFAGGGATPTPEIRRPTPEQTPALSDAQITQAAHGRFIWPVHGDIVGKFGPYGVGQRNDGVDIKAPQGAPVIASAAGQVVYAGDQVKGGYGNLVLIEHSDGWFTAYAHLDKVEVHMQDQVRQGEELGVVGATGDTSQPELHFEIRFHASAGAKTQPVDPALVLPAG